MAGVKAIPDEYPRVIPYLTIDGAAEAIKFYENVIGATESVRMDGPEGKVMHAELKIGDSVVMLADPMEGSPPAATTLADSAVTVMSYVEDVDACYQRALDNGATSLMPPSDQFYGDRAATFRDPFGHRWHVASHIEDVSPEEMEKRVAKLMGGG